MALVATLLWVLFLRGGSSAPPDAARTPVPTRPVAGRVISFDEYTAAFDGALRQVQRALAAEGETRGEAIEAAAQELERVDGVSVTSPREGSAPAEVDNTSLIAAMRGDDPDLERIERSLRALLASLDAEGGEREPGGVLGGEEAIRELDRALRDPAFDYERELSPLQRLARWLAGITGEADPEDTMWRWFLSLVAGLAIGALTFMATERVLPNRWARLFLSATTGTLGGAFFYVASKALGAILPVLGAVGLVVAAIAFALILAGLKRSASAPPAPRTVSDLAAALGMSAGEARGRAGEAAVGGNYRAAIRYRCLAVLLALDEANMLHFDRAATNREYLFRAPGGLQEKLQPLLAQFDAVWYGNAGASEADWREYDMRAVGVEGEIAVRRGAKRAA